jgi:hypothetical protein
VPTTLVLLMCCRSAIVTIGEALAKRGPYGHVGHSDFDATDLQSMWQHFIESFVQCRT